MLHTVSLKKFKPLTVNLKNGTEVMIREAVIQDAPDLIRCIRSYISENPFQVMEPEEFAPEIGQGREFIDGFLQRDNSILLVATDREQIVGNFDITGGRRRRMKHTGLVGAGILKQYQGLGLGKALFSAGIDWARQHPDLRKLWLQIIADNEQALGLYRHLGFVEEGRQRDFIYEGDGIYRDNLLMSLEVG